MGQQSRYSLARSDCKGCGPERQEVIWIDCNPQRGREMQDVHPFLVLSPSVFNARTSLVIGLPMTTAEYNADNPFAVSVGTTKIRKTSKSSYVLCHQPKSFDWREQAATPYPIGTLAQGVFSEVLLVFNQIVKIA
jgi:mRNA interferase MazF